jgi:hypothetical protein
LVNFALFSYLWYWWILHSFSYLWYWLWITIKHWYVVIMVNHF